ncbi:T9SS type A sorting domain-containing protein [Ferruginibacter profundus]
MAAQNFTLTSNADTHATSPTVNALDGSGQVTLRSAMEASTQIAGTHIITIPASITVINLSLGQMTVGNSAVGNNITLNGPGKGVLTINQTTANRIFSTGLNAVTFVMSNLTLNYAGPVGTISGGGGAIQAGGTGSVTTFSNIAINNFNIQVGNGGAILVSAAGAHTFTLTNSDFTNNYTGGGGGAISYNGQGTCTITGCKFTSNKTGPISGAAGTNTGGPGGAIYTTGSGTAGTYSITQCTFITNQTLANTFGVGGGAIANAFGTSTVSYNRFYNNTAANAASGNTIYETGGSATQPQAIIAENNWWGVNTGPGVNDVSVVNGTPAGTITATKWLQLKASSAAANLCSGSGTTFTGSFLSNSAAEAISVANLGAIIGQPITFTNAVLGTLSGAQATIQASGTATVTFTAGVTGGAGSANAVVDNVPNNDATAKASLTVVLAPSITSNPSAGTSCAGLAVSFTAAATNQTSVVWQESTTAGFSSPVTLTNTGIYSGATSGTLTISDNSTVNGRYYRLVASNGNGCGSANSTGALLTATTPSLSANNTVTQAVNTSNNNYYAASCAAVCKVVPSGALPVSGNVTSQVWVEGAVPTVSGLPFVQRHYQVTPATGAATATGTVTLYFSQAEFDNFNANAGSALNLPTGPADAAGKANLRIGKYTGSSGNGTGLPASYASGAVVLDPPDANIVWNAGFSRWEVSVDVVGFSGFIIQTRPFVLPIKLISFTAQLNNNTANVKWQIAQPEEGSRFELQRSTTGSNFVTINTQQGDLSKTLFNYSDPLTISAGKYYYRLQVTDKNGKITFSDIIFVKTGSSAQEITLYPNPVKQGENIKVSLQNITARKMELTTVAGQVVWSNKNNSTGSFIISLPAALAKGMYMVKIFTDDAVEIRKIMIE